MVTVKFTKDFANNKKGDTFECSPLLANRLITIDKVAKLIKKDEPKTIASLEKENKVLKAKITKLEAELKKEQNLE